MRKGRGTINVRFLVVSNSPVGIIFGDDKDITQELFKMKESLTSKNDDLTWVPDVRVASDLFRHRFYARQYYGLSQDPL